MPPALAGVHSHDAGAQSALPTSTTSPSLAFFLPQMVYREFNPKKSDSKVDELLAALEELSSPGNGAPQPCVFPVGVTSRARQPAPLFSCSALGARRPRRLSGARLSRAGATMSGTMTMTRS